MKEEKRGSKHCSGIKKVAASTMAPSSKQTVITIKMLYVFNLAFRCSFCLSHTNNVNQHFVFICFLFFWYNMSLCTKLYQCRQKTNKNRIKTEKTKTYKYKKKKCAEKH